MKPLPLFGAVPPYSRPSSRSTSARPLGGRSAGIARYVGEIVAMVVADTPERAEDAVELIRSVGLPPVVDMTPRREAGAPLIHRMGQ
jgi:CO/xanthine dehydrogenase Mo-binding subunit